MKTEEPDPFLDAIEGRVPFDRLAHAGDGAGADRIEAAPEVLELKRRIFAAASQAAPDDALLASNTSALSIAEIAAATSSPERVVGMHFFNPVPAMKLVEVVRHPRTSAEIVARARDLGLRLGKEPIVVADSPGFASSRLGVLLAGAALQGRRGLPPLPWRIYLLWVAPYALLGVLFFGSDSERWVFLLPVLWLFASVLVTLRLGRRPLAIVTILYLLIINWTTGLWPAHQDAGRCKRVQFAQERPCRLAEGARELAHMQRLLRMQE